MPELAAAAIRASAFRHGLTEAAIRHALRNHTAVADDRHDDAVVLVRAPDEAGNEIEVGVAIDEAGMRIIHAMRTGR